MMDMERMVIVDEKFIFPEEAQLTVHKTSIFFHGDGFIVYSPKGDLLFRFDSYGPDSQQKDEMLLMDANGKCLLTLHRKKPSLHQRWEGFLGERTETQHPVFTMFRSSIIGGSNVVVEVYNDPEDEYQIEGCYAQRFCKIYHTSGDRTTRDSVAEIRRKVDPSSHVLLGKDVFWLCLQPGFDSAFAMGLVLILDQMFDDNEEDGTDEPEIMDPIME